MWTEERIALLQKLWGQGYSASQIATQLQGVTRNAVIGKIHRLGKRPETSTPRARPAVAASHARRRPAAVEARRATTKPLPQPISQPMSQPQPEWAVRPFRRAALPSEPGLATCATLEANMCRWPIGDPDEAGFSFCGRSVDGQRPYCHGHSRLAYKNGAGTPADMDRLLARYL
ncbi:MAG: GcrA family cell cycle regulator [Caulobacteraceae bacterium]